MKDTILLMILGGIIAIEGFTFPIIFGLSEWFMFSGLFGISIIFLGLGLSEIKKEKK